MRYLPHTADDRQAMLARIGVRAIDELFAGVPADKLLRAPPDLPRRQGEIEVERALRRLADQNVAAGAVPFFVGCGAYKHHIPASVDHLIQRSEFLTSYTPYQPEIAQGTLQYLFEFQTPGGAADRDGGRQRLDVRRLDRGGRGGADGAPRDPAAQGADCRQPASALSRDHRDRLAVRRRRGGGAAARAGRARGRSRSTTRSPASLCRRRIFSAICTISQPIAEKAHAAGALLIAVVTEVVSLGLVTPPGEMGADIVVAEGQSLGNALAFGGPYVGLFASRQKYLRQMPGRLAGATVDADGRRGFVLTLSTREQHIRREKATSNICTNSGLCCLAFTIHMTLLGEAGLRGSRGSTTPMRWRSPNCWPRCRACACSTTRSSTSSPSACRAMRRRWSRSLRSKRVLGGVPVSRARARPAGACRSHRRRLDRGQHGRRPRRLCQGAYGGAVMTQTFTGNRALMIEEPLIFEAGRTEVTGVDLDEPAAFKPRLGTLERRAIGLPGLSEPETHAPLCAALAEELRHRQRHVPARLVHDEAQSAPQREGGAASRARRHPSAGSRSPRCRARSRSLPSLPAGCASSRACRRSR